MGKKRLNDVVKGGCIAARNLGKKKKSPVAGREKNSTTKSHLLDFFADLTREGKATSLSWEVGIEIRVGGGNKGEPTLTQTLSGLVAQKGGGRIFVPAPKTGQRSRSGGVKKKQGLTNQPLSEKGEGKRKKKRDSSEPSHHFRRKKWGQSPKWSTQRRKRKNVMCTRTLPKRRCSASD